jgi:hypothetical protein
MFGEANHILVGCSLEAKAANQSPPSFAASWALLRSIPDMRPRPDNGEGRTVAGAVGWAKPAMPFRCSPQAVRRVGHGVVTGLAPVGLTLFRGLWHRLAGPEHPWPLRLDRDGIARVPASCELFSFADRLSMALAALPCARRRSPHRRPGRLPPKRELNSSGRTACHSSRSCPVVRPLEPRSSTSSI